MKIVVTNRAKTDLLVIIECIATADILAADTLREQIYKKLRSLSKNPKYGRPGRVEDTREIILHKSYIAVYQIQHNTIEILTIRHTSRLWPDSF